MRVCVRAFETASPILSSPAHHNSHTCATCACCPVRCSACAGKEEDHVWLKPARPVAAVTIHWQTSTHTLTTRKHTRTQNKQKTKQQNKAVTSFASPLRPGCTFVSSLPVAPFVSPDPSWRTSERTKQEKPHTHTCTEGVFDREQQGNEKNSSKHKRSSAHTHTHNHSQHIQNHARTFLG